MPKFRKTALVEAVQFNKIGDHLAVHETAESPTGFGIFTLENTKLAFEVKPTDWIITGAHGEHYACDDSIFRETYAKVD